MLQLLDLELLLLGQERLDVARQQGLGVAKVAEKVGEGHSWHLDALFRHLDSVGGRQEVVSRGWGSEPPCSIAHGNSNHTQRRAHLDNHLLLHKHTCGISQLCTQWRVPVIHPQVR